MNYNLAPVILFVYNRPTHTLRTVDFLSKNKLAANSELIVFSDGFKEEDKVQVSEVRKIIKTIKGFKSIRIIERNRNLGLARSVITGVTEVIAKYKKAIVLEDDIITSPQFLSFLNEALDFYKDDLNIFSLSGYNFPIKIPYNYLYNVYIAPRASSWGWATWGNRWNKADWDVADFESFIKDKDSVKKFNQGGSDLSIMLKRFKQGKIDYMGSKMVLYSL